ncbi:hypothetical protein EMIT0P2_120017 [Pseudomonas sp. IT-P2]
MYRYLKGLIQIVFYYWLLKPIFIVYKVAIVRRPSLYGALKTLDGSLESDRHDHIEKHTTRRWLLHAGRMGTANPDLDDLARASGQLASGRQAGPGCPCRCGQGHRAFRAGHRGGVRRPVRKRSRSPRRAEYPRGRDVQR